MSQSGASPLIDADALHGLLGRPGTVIVDCRFSLLEPDAGRQAWLAGHIPGAIYAHLDNDLARQPEPHEGRHPLPSPADFAATLGRLGIEPDCLVVAYDDAGGAIAARLWWMLGWIGHARRALLDGGLGAWQAAGLPLETGAVQPQARSYPAASGNADMVVSTAQVSELNGVLLDARAAPRFRGEQEPIDPVAGHVPGAINLPFSDLLGQDGRFLSTEQLRQRFAAALSSAGDTAEDSIVAMCGSGVTACHLIAGLALVGRDSRLYVGSWSEWIRDPARPVAGAD